MENLFNSPFMIKLQDFGQKLGSNKFLSALQAGMMSMMGVIMVGAIFQIICAIGPMVGLFETGDAVYNFLYAPYQYTMNLMGLWLVVVMAYNYARNLKMKSPVMDAVNTTVCFMIAVGAFSSLESGSFLNMAYLGSTGMFTGFIVVYVVVNVDRICAEKNIRIKMPDVCPPFLVDGFASIIPMFFNVVIFMAVSFIVSMATGGTMNFASWLMSLLAAPLNVLVSVPGMFVIGIFASLLWCFGIHGTMIVYPVLMPMMMEALSANAAHAAAGEPLEFFATALFGAMAYCGGTGNTLPLALFGLRSKSKQISAVAKISVVPGWFGINEPMTFGMPIMYNPILCIPYVLNIPLVMLCTYIGYQTGLLMPAYIPIMTLLPMGFANFLGTLNPFNFVWDYLMLIPSGLVWYPFFKAYEKQLVAKEKEAEALEAATAA